MTILLDVLSIAAVAIGALFFMAGTVGLLRFPDALTRLHALTKVDNLGLGFIVAGLLLQSDGLLVALKLVGIWLFVQLSAGIVAQLVAQAIVRQSRPPS
jgi:multicomponent Na+:H+ antiporter subunit G